MQLLNVKLKVYDLSHKYHGDKNLERTLIFILDLIVLNGVKIIVFKLFVINVACCSLINSCYLNDFETIYEIQNNPFQSINLTIYTVFMQKMTSVLNRMKGPYLTNG